MEAFRTTVDNVKLKIKDSKRLLCSGREGRARVGERLDRAFANSTWISNHPMTLVQHGISSSSDHTPLLLDTEDHQVP